MMAESGTAPPKLVAVVPAFNEGPEVAKVVRRTLANVDAVVVVDDCSSDNSGDAAFAAGAVVLRHPINLGQGAALQTGIAHALAMGANYIVTLDADGQHDPDEIGGMLVAMRQANAEVALGSRFLGAAIGISGSRRVVLKLAVAFTRWTTSLDLTDSHNGFRILSAHAARTIRIRQNRMAHASEILEEIARHRLAYTEVPVTIVYTDYSRLKGQSSLNSINILLDLLLHWLRK